MIVLQILWAVLGIIGTVLVYKLNPRQKIYDELDQLVNKELEWEKARDKALMTNDSNSLTEATVELVKIHKRQVELMGRLKTL